MWGRSSALKRAFGNVSTDLFLFMQQSYFLYHHSKTHFPWLHISSMVWSFGLDSSVISLYDCTEGGIVLVNSLWQGIKNHPRPLISILDSSHPTSRSLLPALCGHSTGGSIPARYTVPGSTLKCLSLELSDPFSRDTGHLMQNLSVTSIYRMSGFQ